MRFDDMTELTRPTADEIRNEPVGPRLDAWVHRFVMGKPCRVDYHGNPFSGEVGLIGLNRVTYYSANIAAAMAALFKARNGRDLIITGFGATYRCFFLGGDIGVGKTISEAICRAALLSALETRE